MSEEFTPVSKMRTLFPPEIVKREPDAEEIETDIPAGTTTVDVSVILAVSEMSAPSVMDACSSDSVATSTPVETLVERKSRPNHNKDDGPIVAWYIWEAAERRLEQPIGAWRVPRARLISVTHRRSIVCAIHRCCTFYRSCSLPRARAGLPDNARLQERVRSARVLRLSTYSTASCSGQALGIRRNLPTSSLTTTDLPSNRRGLAGRGPCAARLGQATAWGWRPRTEGVCAR